MLAPAQKVFLEAGTRNVMSVDIPVFTYKPRSSNAANIFSYGFAFTSADLDGAVQSLSDVLPDLLRLAEVEKSCQLMATEIEKTRRRVNALEHVMIPDLQTNIKYITTMANSTATAKAGLPIPSLRANAIIKPHTAAEWQDGIPPAPTKRSALNCLVGICIRPFY